jgi:methane/ammonia monooxygenase subunit B
MAPHGPTAVDRPLHQVDLKRRRAPSAWIALVTLLWSASPSLVWAHGERSQEPFLRMRSILFYDCSWSTDRLKVNDELILSGRFRVFDDWPVDVMGRPDTVYVNTGVPGPVFVRKESFLNGVNMANSTSLAIGGDYEFRVKLRARAPGTYHVHPLINVYNGGPIQGPGKWVTVEAAGAPFTNPEETLTGQKIDLEHFGLPTVIRWHLVWAAVAIAWLLWWARRPMFIPRYILLQRGAEDELVTATDRKLAASLIVLTLAIVIVGNYWANSRYPITIPLQSSRIRVKPLPRPAQGVDVELVKATYEVPGRTVFLDVNVTNHSDTPVRVSEFTTANVRFLNAAVAKDEPGYPRDLIAPSGLVVDGDPAIGPGETKLVHLSATDPVWETERLALLLYDPDSRFGGLLMFQDGEGKRYLSTVGGPILPTFKLKAL